MSQESAFEPNKLENLPPLDGGFDHKSANEFLNHQEKETTSKQKVNLSQDGISKDSAELFETVRKAHKDDSESGIHHEAGFPMPTKARDEKEAAELVEKLIESASGDPFDEINMLGENLE